MSLISRYCLTFSCIDRGSWSNNSISSGNRGSILHRVRIGVVVMVRNRNSCRVNKGIIIKDWTITIFSIITHICITTIHRWRRSTMGLIAITIIVAIITIIITIIYLVRTFSHRNPHILVINIITLFLNSLLSRSIHIKCWK